MNKRPMTYLLIILLCSCVVFSCTDYDDYSGQLVIEGWIDSGSNPVVILTKALSLDEDFYYNDINYLYKIIDRTAVVTIDDGEKNVRLMGAIDRNYIPSFYFTTPEIVGKPGRTYRLRVESQGQIATAETTIPQPLKLDSLKAMLLPGDTLFEARAFFKDIRDQKNYSGFFVRIKNVDTRYYPSFLGFYDDSTYPDPDNVSLKVYPGCYKIPSKRYSSVYSVGDTVLVKFAQMDSISYAVMTSYMNYILTARVSFLQGTENMVSNINGGLGYWCGYGCTRDTLTLHGTD